MDISNVDQRFQSVFHDKRYRSIRQKQKKVKIDRRFHSMFTDDNFKLQYNIDKRGKPLQESSTENLKKYYRIPYKEKKQLKLERKNERNRLKNILNDEKASQNEPKKIEKTEEASADGNDNPDYSSDEYISSDEDSEEDEIDLARGEGNLESSSEEEDDEYDEDIKMLAGEGHNWDQLDEDATRSDDVSSRLALCHMDWDRIKAVDLMVLFEGFKPAGGSVKKVTIYPSDFGVQRLAEENRFGPAELLQDEDSFDDKEAARIQNEKFREHQLNRLKYYYAVIECDSKETADAMYKECDGFEYESSSSKLDLRFIPDDMVFDEHPPKDTAEFLPDKDQYKPNNFVTTALNLTKVNLTWDETDHRRVRLMTRKFKEDELAEMDMKDFIASSSDEEEEEDDGNNNTNAVQKIGISSKTTDQDQIARYRSLLLGEMDGEEEKDEEKDVDMEITWEPTLGEIGDEEDEPLVSDDEDKEKSKNEDDELNGYDEAEVEQKPQKKKSKRKLENDDEIDPKEKAELEMLMIDAEDTKLKHFDIHEIVKDEKMIKKKRRKLGKVEVEDNFKLNMEDSRFSAVFTAPEYAVDPNNPAFRKTKAMKGLVEERQHRLHNIEEKETVAAPIEQVVTEDRSTTDVIDINKLVNSVKMKTKKHFSKKKSKLQRHSK